MFLASEVWENVVAFFADQATRFIASIVTVFFCGLIILISTLIKRNFVKKNLGKRKRAITLSIMINSIIKYIVLIIGILIILSIWGVNVTSLLVGAGIFTLALSLGAQKMVGDVINGVFIVFENYYDIDDVIEVNGFKGKVIDISLRSTKLLNWKNEVRVIANSEILEVTNYSLNPTVGVLRINVAYKEKIDKVLQILRNNLLNIKKEYHQVIEGPNVLGVTNLGENGIEILITVKTESEKHYEVLRALQKYIKELFDANGIEIPFNQIVVHNGDK